MQSLVTPASLAADLAHPDLRLFDATKYLPTEKHDARQIFDRAHLASAQFFDIDLFADQETTLPHMVPTQGRFANLASAAGITNACQIVFYDQKGQSSAARGWWLMRLFGHDDVALLDGGLPAWQHQNLPVTDLTTPLPRGEGFLPSYRSDLLAGLGDILPALAQGALLLDARPADRFSGKAPEPRPGVARGHIPGSISLPFTQMLKPDGTFLPKDDLRQRLSSAGVTSGRRVMTSCGTGVTAAILAFAISYAGFGDAAVYDGSWAEWGARPDTPKEIGS
jgi:thiosulfate/3-mercaptopyruvate sulfurtransferase